MKNTMKQYVDYIVNGGKSTMLGIGPMSPALIQACFELGKEKDLPLMFIASRNQLMQMSLARVTLTTGINFALPPT